MIYISKLNQKRNESDTNKHKVEFLSKNYFFFVLKFLLSFMGCPEKDYLFLQKALLVCVGMTKVLCQQ